MTALIKSRKTDKLGPEDVVLPGFVQYPVADNVKGFAGGLASTDSAGRVVPTTSGTAVLAAQVVQGRCETDYDNTVTGHAAAAFTVPIRQGAFYFNNGTGADAIAIANRGQICYASDDNTVNLTDGGGTRPAVGPIQDVRADGQVCVQVGMASLTASNAEVPGGAGLLAFKANAVVTTIAAYTGTGTNTLTGAVNNAIGVQDGQTLTAGQVLLLIAGVTNVLAADTGPWVVSVVGTAGTKYVLTRPDWWAHGATAQQGVTIDVLAGSLFNPGVWKATAAAAVIGTTDAAWFPRSVTQAVTLVTGFKTVTNVPILSLTSSMISFTPTNFNGAASTVSYRPGAYASGGAATVAGAIGTASASITALVAAGTFNTNDVGTGLLTITNF